MSGGGTGAADLRQHEVPPAIATVRLTSLELAGH